MLLNKDENIEKVERKPSYLTRFLWWCAGVDSDLMKQCTHEWAKYASMGATILFTGMFASIAGGYALYTVFRDGTITEIDTTALYYAIAFGIFWGLVIFNLDRYIITTFKKSASENIFVGFCKDFLHAIPRIILAIIIAITISKPIELKLFEKRLTLEIKEKEQKTQLKDSKFYNDLNKIDEQENNISSLKSQIDSLESQKKEDPQEVKNLLSDKETEESNLSKAKIKYKSEDDTCNSISNNEQNFEQQKDSLGNVFVVKDFKYMKEEPHKEWKKHNQKRNIIKTEIKGIESKIDSLKNQIFLKREKHKKEYEEEIATNDSLLRVSTIGLSNSRIKVEDEIATADSIAKIAFTNNFVTQLMALGSLKRADLEDLDPNNEKDKIIIEERIASAKENAMISWAITLLFLCIELAPMLAKLITSRGVYDELIEAEEYKHTQKYKIQKEKLQIDYEGEIRTHDEEKQIYYAANIEANKKIMNQIASVQIELLETAIEEWRKEELAKIKANPSQYIKSNT